MYGSVPILFVGEVRERTLVNIWTVKRGNAAAMADRTIVFTGSAEAL
jgi:hypothetical protein